jgi:hypothetical protein
MLRDYLTRIAEAIRSLLGTTEKINAQSFPDKVSAVYDAGKEEEWNNFWDNFQDNGKKTYYDYAFQAFNDEIYKPKYPINPVSATQMFYGSTITDLSDINWNKIRQLQQTFGNAQKLKYVGVIDLSHSGAYDSNAIYYAFNGCYDVITIEKIILKESGKQTFTTPFGSCHDLENIVFEGKIGTNITFSSCTRLTSDSLHSILNALFDYSGTSYAGTYKLTLASVSKEKLIAEGAAAPDGLTWDEYVTAKGWTW